MDAAAQPSLRCTSSPALLHRRSDHAFTGPLSPASCTIARATRPSHAPHALLAAHPLFQSEPAQALLLQGISLITAVSTASGAPIVCAVVCQLSQSSLYHNSVCFISAVRLYTKQGQELTVGFLHPLCTGHSTWPLLATTPSPHLPTQTPVLVLAVLRHP